MKTMIRTKTLSGGEVCFYTQDIIQVEDRPEKEFHDGSSLPRVVVAELKGNRQLVFPYDSGLFEMLAEAMVGDSGEGK